MNAETREPLVLDYLSCDVGIRLRLRSAASAAFSGFSLRQFSQRAAAPARLILFASFLSIVANPLATFFLPPRLPNATAAGFFLRAITPAIISDNASLSLHVLFYA
jgi:hypothetical protein